MGFLYLMEFKDKPNIFKIGKTKDNNKTRQNSLEKHHGQAVNVHFWNCGNLYSLAESKCHAVFHKQRIRVAGDGGTEFFEGFGSFTEALVAVEEFVRSIEYLTSPVAPTRAPVLLDKISYEHLINNSSDIDEEGCKAVPLDVVVAVQKIAVQAIRTEKASESISRKVRAIKEKFFSVFGTDSFRLSVYMSDGEDVDYIMGKFGKHHPKIPQKIVRFVVKNKDAGKRLTDLTYTLAEKGEQMLRPYFSEASYEDRKVYRLYDVIRGHVRRQQRN